MTTSSKVILGILGAAAAGVVIGLLVAPEKGADMRKRIRKTAGDWAENVSHLWEHEKEELADAKDKVKDKANKVKESFS
jgi:gas vesicle protein